MNLPTKHILGDDSSLPMTSDPAILFAGGGSGGHISAGLAIAERVVEIAQEAMRLEAIRSEAVTGCAILQVRTLK